MPKVRYVGSPGYEFIFADRALRPAPGDVVELTAEEAATVGPDVFEPVKSKPAPTSANPEES